jgi:hypothetical protein
MVDPYGIADSNLNEMEDEDMKYEENQDEEM